MLEKRIRNIACMESACGVHTIHRPNTSYMHCPVEHVLCLPTDTGSFCHPPPGYTLDHRHQHHQRGC
ncbi:Condensin complex subunit 3 [Fusarium oxysporum f. sp. albedinis]|nr:Condensin complex subunit 3 [Fusarium oxysporum f. sp. albedinis]